jgi:hypothetical protein
MLRQACLRACQCASEPRLVPGDGEDDKATTAPRIDRPNGRAALPRPELTQTGRILQRLHMRRWKICSERGELRDRVKRRLALASILDVLELNNGVDIKDDKPCGFRHWPPRSHGRLCLASRERLDALNESCTEGVGHCRARYRRDQTAWDARPPLTTGRFAYAHDRPAWAPPISTSRHLPTASSATALVCGSACRSVPSCAALRTLTHFSPMSSKPAAPDASLSR